MAPYHKAYIHAHAPAQTVYSSLCLLLVTAVKFACVICSSLVDPTLAWLKLARRLQTRLHRKATQSSRELCLRGMSGLLNMCSAFPQHAEDLPRAACRLLTPPAQYGSVSKAEQTVANRSSFSSDLVWKDIFWNCLADHSGTVSKVPSHHTLA